MPDMEWVETQLEEFIALSKPKSLSGNGVFTTQLGSVGAKADLLERQDIIEPILDRFFPDWRRVVSQSSNYRWSRHHEAAQRCLAIIRRREELEERLGSTGPQLRSDRLHQWVWDAARPQWESGHHADAVDAACRNLNSRLQAKVGRRDVSEQDLVKQALSLKPPEPGAARLRVVEDDGTDTYKSIQTGVMAFGEGCFKAIRNPLAHLSPEEIELDEDDALERLAALSLFARWIDAGTVVLE